MNFPKITLKSKFPSQMLSQSPKDGPPEDSPPFLEASHRDGFLYFHQLYFSYFRFVDWHFLSPIAWNWSMQPFTATLSHFFSKYKDKYKYKDNDKHKDVKRITESLTVCYIFGILTPHAIQVWWWIPPLFQKKIKKKNFKKNFLASFFSQNLVTLVADFGS